jgi:signal transduction histidine kinase/CheY-like chemotaxis protein/HPt (histidine-containing phosphotransfer) domain-containing protein
MTRFKFILSAICIILFANFSLIVHFELEQKRELDRANQFGMDNQLWQFFQLSNEYYRLREVVEYGHPKQLDKINFRFDIYYSRIDSFAKNEIEASALFKDKKLQLDLLSPLIQYIHDGEKILNKGFASQEEWRAFQSETRQQQEAVNDLVQEARTQDAQAVDEYRKNITHWGELRILLATTQILLLILCTSFGLYALWKSEQNRKKLAELADTLQEARQQAEFANATKSRFLAHISHEIRTPLTSILGYADRLLRNKNLAADQKREIGYIANSGTHLLSLLNNVLDLSKSEHNKILLIIETINLDQLKSELEIMFNMMAKEKGVTFTVVLNENLPANLSLDAGKLRQILINLLGNSLKFTQNGAITLTLSGELFSHCYRLNAVVADTGCGIKKEDHPRIFSPFEQSKEGQLAGGTGLGLSLSRDYARLMQGDITFSSEEGKGSEFCVSIEAQIVFASSTPTRIFQPQQQALCGHTILVVEDEAINREMICGILQDFGAHALQAANGLEAILQVSQHPSIDSIIMDYQMPEMDGMTAAGILREQKWKKPIYLVSASPLEELKHADGFSAFSGHLRKPFRIDELIRLLSKRYETILNSKQVLLDHHAAMGALGFKLDRYLALSHKGLNRIAELELLYKEAVNQQEKTDATRYAHSAKGIALQIGAETLGQYWASLEVSPENNALSQLSQLRLATFNELEKLQAIPAN